MIIKLDRIVKEFNLNIRGVIHIGAHYGQEYKDYARQGVEHMIFFEPVRANYEILKAYLKEETDSPNIRAINLALGSKACTKEMYLETDNKGQSCSLLEPGTHLTLHPHISFQGKERVQVERLDNIPFDRGLFNMINIDVQGYELEVFRGAAEVLPTIDYIYSEVNKEEVYKNCCQVEELDWFLKGFGFKRVLTEFPMRTPSKAYPWGDALYIKTKHGEE